MFEDAIMIDIVHISKYFGTKVALKDVSFSLKKGEIVALVGENGAGKSTLMRVMCGYIEASEGEISIFGHNIETSRINALSCIGYVPEISALYGDMKVYDFLVWIARIWNVEKKDEAIVNASKQMKISDVLGERIDNLSKGFKKRVEIASAILHSPQLLILDEPTDGLDPNQKYDIRIFMQNYAKKHIVLVSTHVLEDVDVANRVLMLSCGHLIKDTSINDFKKVSKNHDLSEAFRILSNSRREKK